MSEMESEKKMNLLKSTDYRDETMFKTAPKRLV